MKVRYHTEFLNDLLRFEADYVEKSLKAAARFRKETRDSRAAIRSAPTSAGHFFHTGQKQVQNLRRRNLKPFPFFILYSYDSESDALFFGAIIPSRSNPAHWLARFLKF